MISVEIPKDLWFEIADWSLTNLKQGVEFLDGARPVLVFANEKDRFLFAIRWGL